MNAAGNRPGALAGAAEAGVAGLDEGTRTVARSPDFATRNFAGATNARELTRALGGRWSGTSGSASCPVCQPEARRDQHALSIASSADGNLLLHCHKSACDFGAILGAAGLPAFVGRRDPTPKPRPAPPPRADNTDYALALWAQAVDPAGTLVEKYLRARDLNLENAADIRFHAALRFDGRTAPAMVALMRDILSNEPCGVHRTFLDRDGTKLGRRMLGRAKGACVKLVDNAEVATGIGLSEGVESALAAMETGWRPVWAAASAGGIATFPVLNGVEALTIFADADETGRRAAAACCSRWAAAGRAARIFETPTGNDTNDWLLREARS